MKKLLLIVFSCIVYAAGIAQDFTSSNLPIIIINTNGQEIIDDPKVMVNMGIIFNGPGYRNNITDAYNHYNGKAGIEIRGQSSQQFPMKSYSIELWDDNGKGINKSLFGLPSESDWVLYAPYNDKTLMHNFLAYTISRQMGRWAANCRYAELVLNGEYKGIYVLMEKIKRNSGRVNVSKIGSNDISGDAVTGGYIFSIDKEADAWYSKYPAGSSSVQYSYIYPKASSIAQEQKDYIKNYVDGFEDALFSNNYQDKKLGWRKYADEQSFIDYLIVNEVSRNVDGYRLSSFFYKDRNEKINAGPVWDYDLAFRNANYCDGSKIEGWSWQFNNICPSDFWQVPFWWNKLNADTAFRSNLFCRWTSLRQNILSSQNLYRLIDSISTLTTEARARHFQQWPVLGQYVWPNPSPIPANYEEEISTLKSWIDNRLSWIDNNLSNTGACATYPSNVKTSAQIRITPIPVLSNTNIVIQSAISQQAHFRVYDMNGRLLVNYLLTLSRGDNIYNFDMGTWAKGVYTARLITNSGEIINKRIVK